MQLLKNLYPLQVMEGKYFAYWNWTDTAPNLTFCLKKKTVKYIILKEKLKYFLHSFTWKLTEPWKL